MTVIIYPMTPGEPREFVAAVCSNCSTQWGLTEYNPERFRELEEEAKYHLSTCDNDMIKRRQ